MTTNYTFSSDDTVTMPDTQSTDCGIIEAGNSVLIKAAPGVIVTVEHKPRTAFPGTTHWGIYAQSGGRIILDKTIISSTVWTGSGKYTYGAPPTAPAVMLNWAATPKSPPPILGSRPMWKLVGKSKSATTSA